MIEAPVGYQCPDCVEQGSRRSRADELPYGGRRSSSGRPTVSVLIFVNLAVWIAILLTGSDNSILVRLLSLSPRGVCFAGGPGMYLPGADAAMCATLGTQATWSPGVADGAVWQLVTSGFVHVQFWHILSNMLILWFIGPTLEQTLGRARFLMLYFVSLIGGSAAVMWLAGPDTTTLGASGAMFGLLGALLVLSIRRKGDVRGVLMWIGLNIAVTVVGFGSISWQGHLGGLVSGLAATLIIVYAPRTGKHRTRVQWLLMSALVALLLASVAIRCAQLA